MADWNERYLGDDYAFGTEPNEFVLSVAHHLPRKGKALDLATGEGRNGIFLAQHGLEAEGVDMSEVGLAKAARLAAEKGVSFVTRVVDITTMAIPEAHYQVIASVFCHFPEPQRSDLARRIIEGLAPGGYFVGVYYHPEQVMLGTGGPSDPERLGTLREMVDTFEGLEWIVVEHVRREVREGSRHQGMSSLVHLLGRKPQEV